MSLQLDIPSKTFLAGEYNILTGGDALLISTTPYFQFIIEKDHHNSNDIDSLPFHKDSPGGKFILDNIDIFKNYRLSFSEQHNNCGGFGASGAQFLGSFLAKEFIIHGKISTPNISHQQLLKEFWKYSAGSIKQSGGDIISQLNGSITLFNPQNITVETLQWNFEDISFFLLPTYNKLPTHEHLHDLKIQYDQNFNQIVNNIRLAFINNDSYVFIKYLNIFNNNLLAKNLVANKTIKILNSLKNCPEILAAKGCGALGADVILVIFKKYNHTTVSDFLFAHELSIIASDNDIMSGVKISYCDNSNLSRSYNEMAS